MRRICRLCAICSCVVALLIAASCTSTQELANDVSIIHAEDTVKQSLWCDSAYLSENYLDDKYPIGEIMGFTTIGNNGYLLDDNKAVTCINTVNGDLKWQKRQLGHAQYEMLQPVCLTSDSLFLYVYDLGKRCIMCYDSAMVFKKAVKVPELLPSAIQKVDNGFLCYSDASRRVDFMNNQGKVKYSRIISEINPTLKSVRQTFIRNLRGEVFVNGLYSDTIFIWKGQQLRPYYVVDFGKNKIPDPKLTAYKINTGGYRYACNFFVGNRDVVVSFLDQYLRYVSYQESRNASKLDSASKNKGWLYYPQWQSGGNLYSFQDKSIFSHLKGIKERVPGNTQFIMMEYAMK